MNLATPVAVLFVASMASLVVALVAFLLEVRIAIAVLRIGSCQKKAPGLWPRARSGLWSKGRGRVR